MSSDVCKNDSDLESLPELSDLLPAPSNEILKGDIVWAKFKKLYWPALVRNVYQKEKKITVWYADEPGKSFKLPLNNIFLFHDQEMSTKIKNDVKETECPQAIQAHDGLTTHAMAYLNRKAQGYNDDPLKFFDQTYPYFLMEDLVKNNPNVDKNAIMDIKIKPMYINNAATEIRKKGTAHGPDVVIDSEIESTEDEIESDLESLSQPYKKLKKTLANCLDASESEYINRIVKCVTSGKADTHLANVISKTISSEHHEFYLKAINSNRKDLDFITYGPVEDVKKLREIVFYLLDLYDRKFCKQGKKNAVKSSVSYLKDNRVEIARYVSSVWLPESIIFAVSKINDVSLSEAKKMYNSEITNTTNENQRSECVEVSGSKEEKTPRRSSRLALSDLLKDIDCKIFTKNTAYIPNTPIPKSCKTTSKKTPKRKGRRIKSYS